MKKESSGARAALAVLCIVLGLVLTVMLGGTIYANYLMGLMNRVDPGQQETLSQEQMEQIQAEATAAPDETTAPVIQEDQVDWGQQGNEAVQPAEHIVNILLIGQDSRQTGQRSRSDTMILVTFNKNTKDITLTSFLRDLYVQYPDGSGDKLNHSYAYGGMELLDQCLELNFGVQVDGNVEVDFNNFAAVIDILGGVDMELRSDEAAYINQTTNRYVLGSGLQHLDGEQALQYSRIRHLDSDSDFSRTGRQRKVINALIEKFRNTKLTTLLGLLDDLLPMITTDMSNSDIIGYAKDLFPILSGCNIVSQRVPADDAYYLATIRGMSVVVADMDAARALIAKTMSE